MKRRRLMQGMAASGVGFLQTTPRPLSAMGKSPSNSEVPFTVEKLAAAIRAGKTSASEAAETVIERVESAAVLEAIISFDADGLRAQAAAADKTQQRGGTLGPLHGVPIMLKDNIEAVGFTCTGGTPALKEHRPRRNATVTQRLVDAGAVIAGKANMDELAGGGSTNNPTFGRARNPYNTGHIPGGSSGGSAAVVGGRLVPAALGTDTAGSIRTPAAYCGIAGLRPTQYRVPSDGIVPLALSRDTCGPLATTVADVALIDGILADDQSQVEGRPLKGVRLGLPKAVFQDNLSPAVSQRFEEVVDRLTREGVVFVHEDIPSLAALVEQTSLISLGGAFRTDMTQYLDERETNISFEDLATQIASPFVRGWIEPFLAPGDAILNNYADVMKNVMPKLRRTYESYLTDNQLDGVLFPTAPVTAGIELNINGDLIVEGTEIPGGVWLNIQNTGPASLWGGPGLSIPAGLSKECLPIGIELDGPIGGDKDVLALGLSIEAAMPETPAPA